MNERLEKICDKVMESEWLKNKIKKWLNLE